MFFLRLYDMHSVHIPNAYVFLYVSLNQIPSGGSRRITNLILLNPHALNYKYLEARHCRVSYFFL